MEEHVAPVADTFAYSLLPNHFHFLVRIKEAPDANEAVFRKRVSRCFANLFAAYAMAINKQYGRTGSLFQKNFRRREIDSDQYIEKLILYIHTNAQKHGLITDFRHHRHNSFCSILADRPTSLMRDDVLALFGSKANFAKAHDQYISWLEDEYFLLEELGDD